MAQTEALVSALKNVLKARGFTYARLAKALGLSEASVKRIFAARSFTLLRLDQVCASLGIEITDLARILAHESESPTQLSEEQETELVSNAKSLLVAVHALNHWAFEEIIAKHVLSKAECIELLLRLDKLGIIDLLPNNKIRVRVARNFAWLPDGPIERYFRVQVQNDFFRSRFDQDGEHMVFVNGMLSRTSLAAMQSRIRRMGREFSELHHQDLSLSLSERSGTCLLVAVRPWIPEPFKKLQRKPK